MSDPKDRALEAARKLADACVTRYSDPPAPPGDWMDWQECICCGHISRQSAQHHAVDCPVAAFRAADRAQGGSDA